MECPICLEDKNNIYKMKGCSHSICKKCFHRLKENCLPKKNVDGFYNFIPEKNLKCISCPLCRAIEPLPNIHCLKEKYSKEYKQYLANELCGHYTVEQFIIPYPILKTNGYNKRYKFK
jgi:hypothetical protein